MSSHAERGFTILEAVIALAVVGLAGIGALEAVAGETRSVERAREAYTTSALAQDRLAALTLLAPADFGHPPDSLTRGTFPAPFDAYRWTASVQPVLGEKELYDVAVKVESDRSAYALETRVYRPVFVGVLP